jgi:hypothetical protein
MTSEAREEGSLGHFVLRPAPDWFMDVCDPSWHIRGFDIREQQQHQEVRLRR